MKRNKSFLTLIAGVSALLAFSSCKKQLEEKPYSFLSPEAFYKNESDAKTAINGVYAELYTYDLYLQPYWNMTILDDDHVSGADWFLGTTGAGNPQAYFGVNGPWVGCYVIIARANTVLEKVAAITDITPDMKSRILGEAYFLRGWAYFQLVQGYGAVPLRLHALSVDHPETNVPRSPVKDVYESIISDFKQAETLLFPSTDSRSGEAGRVTRGLAKAFLAKTYLTMASGSLANANVTVRGGNDNNYYTYAKTVVKGLEGLDSRAYFILARDKAQEVLQSGDYALTSNWKDIWSIAGRNSKEFLWEVQSLSGTAFVNNLCAYFNARSTFGTGAVWMTNNHYRDYEDPDKRVLDGVWHNYQTLQGTYVYYPSWQSALYKVVNGITYNNNGTASYEKAYVIKYSSVADPNVANSDAFFPMMRFSELYLIYAEAENEVNPASTNAYNALNAVRTRAAATPATPNMSQQDFRSFVLAERAREFIFEGIRHFDLLRWGIYLQVMNKITSGQNNISKLRAERNLLWPIPLNEINSNTAITENNPGWN